MKDTISINTEIRSMTFCVCVHICVCACVCMYGKVCANTLLIRHENSLKYVGDIKKYHNKTQICNFTTLYNWNHQPLFWNEGIHINYVHVLNRRKSYRSLPAFHIFSLNINCFHVNIPNFTNHFFCTVFYLCIINHMQWNGRSQDTQHRLICIVYR